MRNIYKSELLKLGGMAALAYFSAREFDLAWPAVAVAFLAYALVSIRSYHKLENWLLRGATIPLPLVTGYWRGLADQIYRQVARLRDEQARLKADLDYFQQSFEALTDGVVVLDASGAVAWSNTASRELFGLRFPEDKGRLLVNLLRAPEFVAYFEAKEYDKALSMFSPRGRDMRLEIKITIFRQNQYLLFARDVTDLYKLEQMRRDFVANVSHELRTPLTVISGYLHTLRDSATDDTPPAWLRAFDQMLRQSDRMDKLVEDLIVLSKLETLPVEKSSDEQVNLRSLLTSVRADVLAAYPGKQVLLKVEDGLSLLGRYEELYSALTNLAHNAARYTADDGHITIEAVFAETALRLSVIDDGEGIESVHLPRLTERFYRADESRSSETGGTGLGLAIVKHALARHGAWLEVESQVSIGSAFHCYFPLERVIRSSQRQTG